MAAAPPVLCVRQVEKSYPGVKALDRMDLSLHSGADSVAVLRDGRVVGTLPVAEASVERVAQMLVGGSWQRARLVHAAASGEVVLSARGLSRRGKLHEVSFDLYRGKVLGIAGLLGAGRRELLRSIAGIDPFDTGTIRVNGEVVHHSTATSMQARGIGLIPEDRKRDGLVLGLTVSQNRVLAALARISWAGLLSRRRERQLAGEMVARLSIPTRGLDLQARTLSGGNQQKLVIHKWLNARVRVLVMDEPTRSLVIIGGEIDISVGSAVALALALISVLRRPRATTKPAAPTGGRAQPTTCSSPTRSRCTSAVTGPKLRPGSGG